MEYIWLSFLAGMLTIVAPCVLPLLPVIIGGSLTDRNPIRPLIITLSLATSIVFFTLILKVSPLFIDIPQSFWEWFSGTIILFFGVTLLFPHLWEKYSVKLNCGGKSQGLLGMIFIGLALGPVFASCSPTYFLILRTLLPQSFFWGLVNLIIYALGLAFLMFLMAIIGQRFIENLKITADPNQWLKKGLGLLFCLIGIGIISGYDKKFESWVIDHGWFGITQIEQHLVDQKSPKLTN